MAATWWRSLVGPEFKGQFRKLATVWIRFQLATPLFSEQELVKETSDRILRGFELYLFYFYHFIFVSY